MSQSILFICHYNSIRSPMAAALWKQKHPTHHVESAGLLSKDIDGFAIAALREINIDIANHEPQLLDQLKGQNFDQVITLSQEAYDEAKKQFHKENIKVSFWDVHEPQYFDRREDTLQEFRKILEEIKAFL